ncbi:MAG: aquaporin [Alphaproteobacteria bacterium]|nr:aquaporin [Alphaproteobacteria bacterium]
MLSRRLFSEGLGSVLLTATVIGSGVLASRLADGNAAIALLGNTLATAAMLFVLVTSLGGVSGAHFNPAVTLVAALDRHIRPLDAALYIPVQIGGCILGAWLAHLMFELPVIQVAATDRSGAAQMLSEAVATFALVFAIRSALCWKPEAVAASVALVIAAGYWWTASTSFANPAITIARSLSDTFAGVRPEDTPGFIFAQLVGAVAALVATKLLFSRPKPEAAT